MTNKRTGNLRFFDSALRASLRMTNRIKSNGRGNDGDSDSSSQNDEQKSNSRFPSGMTNKKYNDGDSGCARMTTRGEGIPRAKALFEAIFFVGLKPHAPSGKTRTPPIPQKTRNEWGTRQQQIPFGNDKQKVQRRRFWLRQNDESW